MAGAYQSHLVAPITRVGVLADVAELTSNDRSTVAATGRPMNRRPAATSANHPVDQAVAVAAAVFDPGAHDCRSGG